MTTSRSPADRPLVVQSDRTVLLEVDHPLYAEVRDVLARFAELEKSPEYIHTYRITALSVWNALAAGFPAGAVLETIDGYSKYPVPDSVAFEIRSWAERYGRLRLAREDEGLVLRADEASLLDELLGEEHARRCLGDRVDATGVRVADLDRGRVKQALLTIGYPVDDVAGYVEGASLPFERRETTIRGEEFRIRPYQQAAADVFHAGGGPAGGSGVVVLPCGAGKTIVGIAAMEKLQTHTLILCTNITAMRQWIREILDKTTLTEEQVGEYSGDVKTIRPVTVSNYQILTYRRRKTDEFAHFGLLCDHPWGLLIYDEVHLLPAPVFRVTAEIQARRRLGLTATLVREDERESDVFTLVGPKRYDMPWKLLEKQGWIATARCVEVRVPLAAPARGAYATSNARDRFRIASENDTKNDVVSRLLREHASDRVLIIGQYLDQLTRIAQRFRIPLITGRTKQAARDELYEGFRSGEIPVLAVSKVGNFSIDLPDANVLIQVSGTFGSRQEEAQRLGRVLRPKTDGGPAVFYTLVTRESKDQDFAAKRQLFLTEQGYGYEIRSESGGEDADGAADRIAAGVDG